MGFKKGNNHWIKGAFNHWGERRAVNLVCPICSVEFQSYPSRIKDGRGKFCSRKCSSISKKENIKERNPNWRGGRFTHTNGYIVIRKPNHPKANRKGYIYEHRFVAENKIGRILKDDEVAHHLDGDKKNNNQDNIVVMKVSDHARLPRM